MKTELMDSRKKNSIGNRGKKRWYCLVSLLSVVVVFVTIYALTYPASTVSEKMYCGFDEHTHSVENGCFTVEKVLVCENEDPEHIHTDECYSITETLICEKPEHSHSLQCYSDPDCVETPDVWERTLENVELSDDIRANVIAVAESQLGYTESTENYKVEYLETVADGAESDENAIIKGYSRYGAWCGAPYDDWSGMFCGFCIRYAGIEESAFPFAADCDAWVKLLFEEGTNAFHFADEYTPAPGDIVFFDNDNDLTAERAGIVVELVQDTSGALCAFKTIEGDLDNEVQITTRNCSEGHILGYGVLPFDVIYNDIIYNNEEILSENKEVSDESDKFVDAADTEYVSDEVNAEQTDTTECDEIESPLMLQTVTDDGITVTVTAESGVVPYPVNELSLSVVRVYDERLDAVASSSGAEGRYDEDGNYIAPAQTVCSYSFDIKIIHTDPITLESAEVEPYGEVSVSFGGIDAGPEADIVEVFHVDAENGINEQMESSIGEDGTIVIGTDHFSIYLINVKASGNAIGSTSSFANLRNGGTYYLSADLTIGTTVTISNNTTLDLNGHKLTVTANPLFNITGGSLTIKDTGTNNDASGTVFDTPYAHAASYSNGTLTYYVTETYVSDPSIGKTTETLTRHSVSRGGMIVGNKNGRAITMSGGTLNLQGGYICNFGVSNGNGGAIDITGGTVNLSGTVIAANTARSGGAIHITNNWNSNNNVKLNITGGIISGNTANGYNGDNANADGGGGIFMEGNSVTVSMSDGYITNNIQTNNESDNYWHGGGGVLLANGSRFNLSGGGITGNYALGGGGGIKTRQNWGGSCKDGGQIYMTGGFLTANNGNKGEGGAANINARGYMELTGGYVTNNVLGGGADDSNFQDWGGGGLFCSENDATIYVLNALVTENEAGGFGAGIAGCSTGRISIVGDNGAAIYDNTAAGIHTSGDASTKSEDHTYALNSPVFMENGYQDYYCALSSSVSGGMLGGGVSNWTGSADGMPVTSTSKNDMLTAATVMGLTAHPSSADKLIAQQQARVFITGNESPTHGGGILANGFLIMGGGESFATYARLELSATKQLYNKDGLQIAPPAAAYNFIIVDDYGQTIATATNDANGNIIFDRRIPFTEAGTYTYDLYEVQPEYGENAGVQYDTARYRIVITVSKNSVGKVPGRSDISMYEYRFENITVTDVSVSPNVELYNDNPGNNTAHAISFSPTGGRPFVNRQVKAEYVSVEANKVWTNGPSGKSPIQVTLLKNGVPEATATLSASNGWKYTWNNLPSEANYSVMENPVSGYFPDYAYRYINVTEDIIGTSNEAKLYRKVGNYFVPLNSVESGQQYIIASPDGDKLLCTTHAHADAALTSSDVVSATRYTGNLRVNGNNYTSWYIASEVPENCIYTSMTTDSQGYSRICFKNNVEYSWLLVQSTDTGFFKGAAGEDWSSGFRVSNGHLQGQVEWASGNQWRYIIWTGSKFDTASQLSNIVYTNITGSTKVATITNTPMAETRFFFNMLKHDSDNVSHVLPGAVFNLKDSNNNILRFRYVSGRYTFDTSGSVTELVTDNRGYVRVTGLPAGVYSLTEIQAPNGYILSSEPITVKIDESTPNRTLTMNVENSEITYELPETGGSGSGIYYISGILLVIVIAICGVIRYVYKRERRDM